ncbi:hypothetical protein DFR68_13018 [Nocardia mexicana]|uniref:Uncharacterized protein n=1 Tax=Nocardia mexicana TaxID=279262 RepID=A0A370GF87_9NOCA|nr:hypothetical protein DFR68_13018 [Nocardia mexicana]
MAVSTTTSPVTQTADVEVNTAVTTGVQPLDSEEIGSINNRAPSRFTAANPATVSRAGCPSGPSRRMTGTAVRRIRISRPVASPE